MTEIQLLLGMNKVCRHFPYSPTALQQASVKVQQGVDVNEKAISLSKGHITLCSHSLLFHCHSLLFITPCPHNALPAHLPLEFRHNESSRAWKESLRGVLLPRQCFSGSILQPEQVEKTRIKLWHPQQDKGVAVATRVRHSGAATSLFQENNVLTHVGIP